MRDANRIETQYRSMLILWMGQMMSLLLLFGITQVVEGAKDLEANNVLSFALAALGTFVAIISFVVKSKLLQQSVEKQDLALVQKAYIVAGALAEVPVLLGVLERFSLVPGRDYLVLILIGFITMALHFPRKVNLLAASYKDPSFGASY